MRKAIIGAGAATFLILGASSATAETERVNAAENATRLESIGEFCDVFVDDFAEMEVNVYCFAPGRRALATGAAGPVRSRARAPRVAARDVDVGGKVGGRFLHAPSIWDSLLAARRDPPRCQAGRTA